MTEFVRAGNLFTTTALKASPVSPQEARRIRLASIGDHLFILDGHARLRAIQDGGRGWVDPAEFQIKRATFADFAQPSLARHWYYPIDLRIECLLADTTLFRQSVARCKSQDELDEACRTATAPFKEPRRIYRVAELT